MYRLFRYINPVTLIYISCSSDFDIFYVHVWHLNFKAYNHLTFHSASSWCTDLADTVTRFPWPICHTAVTLTHFTSTFDSSSTIRPTTTKPCIVLHLIVLTWQVPWPIFDTFYVDVQYLLNYKAYNHHILHSASPWCTDLAGTLTWWPWPIFHAPVTFTYFMSTFHYHWAV